MLTGQAQTCFYANQYNNGIFERFCYDMRQFFEGPEWQRYNLTKWQTMSLAKVISANPTLSITECLRKLCTDLDTIQRGMDPTYHGPVHLRENIIRACRGHPTLATGLTNPPLDASGLVNSLYTSIVNYEAVHNPVTTQQSYTQAYKHDDDDNEAYFTDRQYRKGESKAQSSRMYGNGKFRNVFPRRNKKCFVCGKEGCWSTNHTE